MDGFDPTLLRSFLVVAQEASFTRAAERLHLTQSAVSAHVRRLEENLERQLFSRSTRSVALTEEGETLLGYARAILQLNEKAKLQLSGKPRSVHLRIGSTDDFMSSWLPRVLHDFQTAYSAVSLEVCVANMATLLAKLNGGGLDLVVGSRCNGRQTGSLLRREKLVWAYSDNAVPDNSAPLPLGLFPEPCPYRDAAMAALADRGRDWRLVVESRSVSSLRAAAAAGLAVVPLNQSALTPQLRALGAEFDMPPLPDVELMVFTRDDDAPGIAEIRSQIIRAANLF
jgi:DNA-binding transcriptional LysR family regulator